MAPRAFNSSKIQQPVKQSKQHNPRANRTIHGRKFDANGLEIKPITAQAPVIERWIQATCPRCLQVHLTPTNEDFLVSNTRKWWCTQRPATKRERNLYINNLNSLALMDAAENSNNKKTKEAACEGIAGMFADKAKGKNAAVRGGGRDEKPPRRDDELDPEAKKKEEMRRERKQRRSDMARVLDDDPVGDGVELAFDPEATLPSDGKPAEHKERHFTTGEKYHDIDTMLTMDDIRHEEPTFVIKTVTRRRRGKKGGKKPATNGNKTLAGEDEDEDYEFVDGAEDDNDDVLLVAEWEELE